MNADRVLLYATGRSGVGQTRRLIRIASYLRATLGDRSSILLLTVVPNADRLFRCPGVDIVSPDSILDLAWRTRRHPGDEYQSLSAAVEFLSKTIEAFRPGVFVTASSIGIVGETVPLLDKLQSTRCSRVLVLRDIYTLS
ncbi:hypothetical protein ACW9HQ_37935, partial [Nocardia gipuzkoensis]